MIPQRLFISHSISFSNFMKEFIQVFRRFVPPYKRYLWASVLFNILSAVLNIFSFAALIPILNILFKVNQVQVTTLMPWPEAIKDLPRMLANNANYYVQVMIDTYGSTTTLLLIGLFLAFMTFLKTAAYSQSVVPQDYQFVAGILL